MDRNVRTKDSRSAKVKLAAVRRKYNELFKDTVARSTQLQELKKKREVLNAEVSFLRKRVRLLRQLGCEADMEVGGTGGGEGEADVAGSLEDEEALESEGQECVRDPSSNEYEAAAYEVEEAEAEEETPGRPAESSSEEISGFTTSRSASPPVDDFDDGESPKFVGSKDFEYQGESASASDDDLDVYESE